MRGIGPSHGGWFLHEKHNLRVCVDSAVDEELSGSLVKVLPP